MLAPAMLAIRDPIARLSFGFAKFLHKAIADPSWARLVVQSSQSPAVFGHGIRAHVKADMLRQLPTGE